MDKSKRKLKKEKFAKTVDKGQPPVYIKDIKTIKENLKIKEILRTVKMNSSMRIKAPRGSKVMHNKDFNDSDEIFEDTDSVDCLDILETPSATNPDVIVSTSNYEINEENIQANLSESESNDESISEFNENDSPIDIKQTHDSSDPESKADHILVKEEIKEEKSIIPDVKIDVQAPSEYAQVKARDRKLSLDQTILSRREGLSQSELDLNSIGKSPLERKSSFFRKKMESFLKNTTEIFKRQSISKSQSSVQRRGSMSVSLQSLNENNVSNEQLLEKHQEELQGSVSSLQSSVTACCSNSSLSSQAPTSPDIASLTGSQPALIGSQPLAGYNSNSIHGLNEAYIQESLLNSRAISMSSGLDSAHGKGRKKDSRSNRVTWVASEGLTNYLRRIIQDEKSRDMHTSHSFQDFSSIPESNICDPKTDSKGRRLSYQRAVSGEDPVLRYQDNSLRRKNLIPENFEANFELSARLEEYTRNGIPQLQSFSIVNIPDAAIAFLQWAENPRSIEQYFTKNIRPPDLPRQAVIRELICTEADYVHHLMAIVEVFIATAHDLQNGGKLLNVDTARLFINIPDVLNASLSFWEHAFYPMIADAVAREGPFNAELMASGFCRFGELFHPYEQYVNDQTKALDYLRSLNTDTDFMTYLTWCHNQEACKRLQLSDIMAKPMQRLTKYSLLLNRIMSHTDVGSERVSLIAMESCVKSYVLRVNRSMRQRDELEIVDQLETTIEPFEIEFKDEDLDILFRTYTQINLSVPMVNCRPYHRRTLIFHGDLRYKDNQKETDVHVYLLTDMMLICKKLSKGSYYAYKLIRQKYMIDKMVCHQKFISRNNKDVIQSLVIAMVDDVGSSFHAFSLSESSKETNPQGTLKIWEQKVREAKLTYELGVWLGQNPSRNVNEIEMEPSPDTASGGQSPKSGGGKHASEDLAIEREARDRVITMLYKIPTNHDSVQTATDSLDVEIPGPSTSKPPSLKNIRRPIQRNSTGSSPRSSRLSSFQQSTSADSCEKPQSAPIHCDYKAGSSVEHLIPPLNPEDGVTSITVNVVSDGDSDTVSRAQPLPPLVVLQQPSPRKPPLLSPMAARMPSPTPPRILSPMQSRSSSVGRSTLRVQPHNGVMALVHSLPDLTLEYLTLSQRHRLSPQTASAKLYQSHQELLLKNRLAASTENQNLTTERRGTSLPSSMHTRATLKRGMAFSYSFRCPPLIKMDRVNSQSQLQPEPGPYTSQEAQGEEGSRSPEPSTSTAHQDEITSRDEGTDSSNSGRQEGRSN